MPSALTKSTKKPATSPKKAKASRAASSATSPAKPTLKTPAVAAPVRDGFGALPHEGGVTFRVWAPNATAVSVIGSFNNWNKQASPLRAEAGGNWAGDLPQAKAGDEYKYVLQTPWGMNRPDYGRPEVRRYIMDNVLMWLEDYHCDGLRMDAIAFIRNVKGENNPGDDLPDGWSLMRWINEEIQRRQPWKITIAEDLRAHGGITGDTEQGGEGFSTQWCANFIYPLQRVLTTPNDADRRMHEVASAICAVYNGSAFQRVIYTESHDEVANGKYRLAEEIMPGNVENYYSKKRTVLGAALTLTAAGIPMLFQGQEFLAPGSFNDNEPLNWEWAEQHGGMVQLYRDLIALRRNQYGHTPGLRGQGCRVFHVNDADKLIAFARWDGDPQQATVVIVNFANQAYPDYTIGLPADGKWKVRFNSDWHGYDREFDDFDSYGPDAEGGDYDGYPQHGRLDIGPYAAIVLSRE